MSVNEETYHVINDYLSGELKGRALDKFKAELKTDTQLQEALSSQRSIIEAIEYTREKELKAFLSNELSKKKTISLNPKWRIAVVSAAAVALLAVAIFSITPLLQKKNANTAQEAKQNTTSEATESMTEDNAEENQIADLETTQVDTQTLAIVAPPAIEEAEAEKGIIEDYKTDIAELDITTEELEEEALEDDMDGATDEYTEAEKLVIAKENKATTGKPVITDSDITVRSDELLSKKAYPVYAAALNLDKRATSLQEVAVAAKEKDTRRDKKAAEDAANEVEKVAALPTRSLQVEYWKSVVNYKGYQYDGKQVKLYGVDQQKALNFKELDNRLYLQLDNKQYFVEKNQKYNRLVEVTNPTLLKVLNE